MIALLQKMRGRLFVGSALSICFSVALAHGQRPTVSVNGNTGTASEAQEDTKPPPPPPKDEFTLLAERLTEVKVPKKRVTATLGKAAPPNTAGGSTDFSGKVLVQVTVDPKTFPSYTITSGDRLYNIAHEHYGSGHYGEFLAAHNDIDPSKLRIGQNISMPSFDDAFNAAGLYPLMSEECAMILKAQADFVAIEPHCRAIAGGPISVENKEKLLACRKLVLDAMHALGRERAGVRESPESVRVQLRSCAENFNRLAKGRFSVEHIARVHQRLGYSISYAIIWARNGYE